MHANGRGIAQDFQEAIKWYTKSAEQGNVNAQYNLGNLYLRGQGASQNDNLAFSWFIKAAEQGDAPAQYNLGRMYLLGKGGDKNFLEARFWIKQALENNDEYIGALAQQVWDDYKLGTYKEVLSLINLIYIFIETKEQVSILVFSASIIATVSEACLNKSRFVELPDKISSTNVRISNS